MCRFVNPPACLIAVLWDLSPDDLVYSSCYQNFCALLTQLKPELKILSHRIIPSEVQASGMAHAKEVLPETTNAWLLYQPFDHLADIPSADILKTPKMFCINVVQLVGDVVEQRHTESAAKVFPFHRLTPIIGPRRRIRFRIYYLSSRSHYMQYDPRPSLYLVLPSGLLARQIIQKLRGK